MAAPEAWREVSLATAPSAEKDGTFSEIISALRTCGVRFRLFHVEWDEWAALVDGDELLTAARTSGLPIDSAVFQDRQNDPVLLFTAAGAVRAEALLGMLAGETLPKGTQPLALIASPAELSPLLLPPGPGEASSAFPRVTEKIGEGPEHLEKRAAWFGKRSGQS